MIRRAFPSKYALPKSPIGLADTAILLALFLIFYIVARVGSGFFVAFKPPVLQPRISLDPANLPYYVARSTLRMFIALIGSILFTFIYGYIAAKNSRAEKVMIPLLDILQSVPVLGFLSVTVTGFMAMFPGSLFGLEMASLFAIFTGQVWNMTFSFYHSLITLPKELDEAATLFRFSKWRRFISVEVPVAMIGLVWNGMMSFGGGWFFVTFTEAITVNNKSYTLPGIGAYVAMAVKEENFKALTLAILSMILLIVGIDQLFWRPVVAWAEKFRMDKSTASEQATSWVLDLLRSSRLPRILGQQWRHVRRKLPKLHVTLPKAPSIRFRWKRRKARFNEDLIFGILIGTIVVGAITAGANIVTKEVPLHEIARVFLLGILTFLRVVCLLLFASAVWTPIGVAIGFNPKLSRIAQPIVLILASFPANFIFPAATWIFIKLHLGLNFGSIVLMILGAQWYVLFNTIAGAMAVPNDLREMAVNMRLSGWPLWRKLILPAIFPAWVTGAITASGGAWNASIVSEVVNWGNKSLTADGIGAYITHATTVGDSPRIVLGVSLMCVFVVLTNRLFWRRLYSLAETRYRLG
ncbi:MAG: ABC transporter permease subunit [Fimbriimonas sp.]|nr:ABC transporter permease subunit [Fimbriimonas sp.]